LLLSDPAEKTVAIPVYRGADRRKHPRHEYIERVLIYERDGTWTAAMSFEISVGGMSVATAKELEVGERVKLSPVVGKRVAAVVRRKQGSMYGLEFMGLTSTTKKETEQLCDELPPFRSMADI
jgi:hypothetical protein